MPSKMRKRVLVVPWSIEPINHCLSSFSSCMGNCASLLSLETLPGLGRSVGGVMVCCRQQQEENGPRVEGQPPEQVNDIPLL